MDHLLRAGGWRAPVTGRTCSHVEITGLTSQARSRWTELWTAYLAFYKLSLPDEIFEHTWARLLNDTAIHGLAARIAGRSVGLTHFLFHESAWIMAPVCYLQDLFVEDSARGHGVGRTLIETVAARARMRDSVRLYWMTQSDNTTARLLYDRLARHSGFIRYEYPLN